MKYVFSLIVILSLLTGTLAAQTASETFAKILPDLSSADAGKRDAAQNEWQKVCMQAGTPDQKALKTEVNKLMVDALHSDAPLDAKYWFLQQLQWTGDASVVPTLVKLLEDKDNRLRDRASRALALNPSTEAANALKAAAAKLDGVRGQTVLDAEKARTKLVAAPEKFPFASARDTMEAPYLTDKAFDKLMSGFDKAEPREQARILAALKVREDKNYTNVVVKAIQSGDEFVKKNAVLALEKLATVKELPLLLDLLQNYDRGLVETVLVNNAADGINEGLLKAAAAESDPGKFEKIVQVLSKRNVAAVLRLLLDRAGKENCPNRLALLQIAENVSKIEDLGSLIDIATQIPAGRDRDEAEKIIARIANQDASAAIAKLNDSNAAIFLPMIGRIGGEKALEAVKKYLSGKTENDAVRALCNWPNAVVADDLLAIAESPSASDQNKIAALRAFARVISLRDEEIGIRISGKDKIAKLDKAMNLAQRDDEKKLILSRLSAIRNRESIEFALKFVSVPELQDAAYRAIVDLAHHDGLRRPNKNLIDPALDQIIENSKDQGLKDRAKRYRNAP